MNPRLWASFVIFVSGYSPLSIILAINDFDIKNLWFSNPLLTGCVLDLSLISILITFLLIRNISGGFPAKVVFMRNRSNDLINYSIPYLISFISLDLGNPITVASFTFFMFLLFLLTLFTDSLFINPILAIYGYGLYDVEYKKPDGTVRSSIFLAKRKIKIGDTLRITKLTPFSHIET